MMGYSQLATILAWRIGAFIVKREKNTWQRQHSARQVKVQVHHQFRVLSQTAFAIVWNQLISHEQLIKANWVSLVMDGPLCFGHQLF